MATLAWRAPFRIHAQRPTETKTTEQAAPTTTQAEPTDPYFARLVKLVPAEVLALYVTFRELLTNDPVWSWVCLGLVVLVRTIGTRQAGKPIQWIAVAVATISFALWIYATGGELIPLDISKAVLSATVGVWTFVVPYLYKGDES